MTARTIPLLPKALAPLAAAVIRALVGVGLGVTLAPHAAAQPSDAQQPRSDARNRADSSVEEVIVTDRLREPYRVDASALTKLTENLRDTPQSITTLSRDLLEDRAAMSLNDALRTVPGITLGAGEFSWQGNNPSIRGFSSRDDMFLDGMRDFGMYVRDPFNLETIEVLEGPSSTLFGRGSTGGVIHQVSKRPLLDPMRRLAFNGGSDSTARATIDVNQPLPGFGEGAAVRVNAMAHHGEVADRDGALSRRYGVAPSLALGLGTPTRLTLSYFKQTSDDRPDYGLPWLHGRPAPVRRDNFYGFESDFLETEADVLTANLAHTTERGLAMNFQVRYADYERDSRLTEPLISGNVTPDTPLEDIVVNRNVFRGHSEETMFQTQIDVTARFATGRVEHALVAGVEAGRETSSPTFGFGTGVPGTSLLTPNTSEPFTATGTAPRLEADTVGKSAAFYALDTIKFGEQWQLIAGVRRDRFDADYEAARFAVDGTLTGTEQIARVDDETSWRAAVVYKPAPTGSVYLSWGTSFNPSAESLSFITSGRGLAIANAFLAPEENESVEVGTKWDLIGDSLSLTAAVFRIDKTNARVPDPVNPGFNMLAGEFRVEGFAVNAVGRVGDRWRLTAGYTHLDSEVRKSAPGAAPVGSPLAHAPEHSLSLWANYLVSEDLEIGAGTRYVDERLAQNAPPVKSVPDYWSFDAMARYHVSSKLALKLNLTNIGDEYYFDQLHPWHVVPGPGFTATFAINYSY